MVQEPAQQGWYDVQQEYTKQSSRREANSMEHQGQQNQQNENSTKVNKINKTKTKHTLLATARRKPFSWIVLRH
jgi:hypothetical protein